MNIKLINQLFYYFQHYNKIGDQHYYLIYTQFFIAVIFGHLATVTLAARRVDAHVRARETMQRRRDVSLLQRRDVDESLDFKELFKLTEGEYLKKK